MESLSVLNERLIDHFGKFEDGCANWRIVWSEDQFEKRITKYSDSGIELLQAEVRELPKYRQWIQNKFVLERLFPVPEMVETDLITKITYEPVWVFEDKLHNPLPADWEVTKLVIDSVYTMAAKTVGAKYKDPDSIPEEARENTKKRLDKLSEELFGNETETGDALAHKQAIVVP